MNDFKLFDLALSLPEIVIAIGAILILILGMVRSRHDNTLGVLLSCAILIAAIAVLTTLFDEFSGFAFSNLFVINDFIIIIKIILLISAIPIFCLLLGNKDQIYAAYEFPVLMLLAILGMMMMLSANDFIVFYMGLELQSLALYVLASFAKDDSKSSEAGLKYFILGAVGSGIMLYGISLIYGFSGSTNFSDLALLYQNPGTVIPLAVIIGMIMVLINIFFKLGAAPFHMWIPDVYEGAPTISVAFFTTTAKAAALLFLIRLCISDCLSILSSQWQQIIIFGAASSMIIGAIAAIGQTKLKRLFAYSSIAHLGFMLLGVEDIGMAVFIYLIIYIINSWGVFAFISCTSTQSINNLQGLAKSNPLQSFCMAIFMLSMAGVPPLAGFFAKYDILVSAIGGDLYIPAFIAILTSVISCYYYLRIIKVMYFDTAPEQAAEFNVTLGTNLVMILAMIMNIIFFLLY